MKLELFGCAGGMAEGFRRAGIELDVAVDWDADACASYTENIGHRPIQMDVRDLLRMAQLGWFRLRLDLLVADPPCTPWSHAGKRRGLEDERDMLRDTVELVRVLRPDCYLIGNVPGLDESRGEEAVEQTIATLGREGYCTADFVRLDAADYGVPQHRVRPFWFGHLSGACIRWPTRTHGPPTQQTSIEGEALAPWVTVRQALQHLPPDQLGRPVRVRWKKRGEQIPRSEDGAVIADPRHPPSQPDGPASTIAASQRSQGGTTIEVGHRHRVPSRFDEPALTVTQAGDRGGRVVAVDRAERGDPPPSPEEPARAITAKQRGRGGELLPWPWDRPATTVQCDPRIPPPGHHDNNSYMSEGVVISERAAAILQGFPEGWRFVGKTKKARWSQIGQAMPPPLAEAVARSILQRSG